MTHLWTFPACQQSSPALRSFLSQTRPHSMTAVHHIAVVTVSATALAACSTSAAALSHGCGANDDAAQACHAR